MNTKGKYVDGFVLVVPKDKTEEYKKMAEEGRDAWMKFGALEYYECMGDDLNPKPLEGAEGNEDMKHRQFTEMTGAKENENVWFSFIVFESREHRDEVNAKVMQEMSEKYKDHTDMAMPFEIKRMAYGGFQSLVEGK